MAKALWIGMMSSHAHKHSKSEHLLHRAESSSDMSSQSGSRSHFHSNRMHWPLAHWKSPTPQWASSTYNKQIDEQVFITVMQCKQFNARQMCKHELSFKSLKQWLCPLRS